MLTDKELHFQRAVISVQRRLIHQGKLVRSMVRQSCLGFSDEQFERLLDAIVVGGIATRERGKRGAEVYRSTIQLKPTEVSHG
jgi:hypothetical protein